MLFELKFDCKLNLNPLYTNPGLKIYFSTSKLNTYLINHWIIK